MKPFLSFQGSRACFFSDLFTGESCPLRIPLDKPLGHEPFDRELRVERLEAEWLGAAVSPIPKSRKERLPPASLSRNSFMVLPVRGIPRQKKRRPYPSGEPVYGVKAIIDEEIVGRWS
jgi:hypothetical protein